VFDCVLIEFTDVTEGIKGGSFAFPSTRQAPWRFSNLGIQSSATSLAVGWGGIKFRGGTAGMDRLAADPCAPAFEFATEEATLEVFVDGVPGIVRPASRTWAAAGATIRSVVNRTLALGSTRPNSSESPVMKSV
jgi:ribosomal protein S11